MRLAYLLQRKTDLPVGVGWLSPAESATLDRLRFPRRRGDWLLGRWTAKSALLRAASGSTLADWQIEAAPDGAPQAFRQGKPADMPLSLSHRRGMCLCVLSAPGAVVGCDLEYIEHRSGAFEETWFTEPEIRWLGRAPPNQRDALVTLIWSAKESALKALRLGLTADTRRVRLADCCRDSPADWQRLVVEDDAEQRMFHGWWRQMDDMICTMLTDRETLRPRTL